MDDTILKMRKLKAKGFCCSQIMATLALEVQGKDNPDLVKAMGGLCFGSYAGDICGALSAGTCIISLYAGKGEGDNDGQYLEMIFELVEWFKQTADKEYGGIRCDDILEKFPDRSICSLIVTDTYNKCMDILSNHGFNPTNMKE